MPEELAGVPIEQHLPFRQHQGTPCVFGHQAHIVGDQDDRVAPGVELVQDAHQFFLAVPVEAAGGLVQDQDFRLHGGNGSQSHLPALAEAEQRRWRRRIRAEPEPFSASARRRAMIARRELLQTQPEADLLFDGRRKDLVIGVLEHEAYQVRKLRHAGGAGVVVLYEDSAGARAQQAVEVPGQGAFARAVWAYQGQEIAGMQHQAHIAQGRRTVHVGVRHVLHGDLPAFGQRMRV